MILKFREFPMDTTALFHSWDTDGNGLIDLDEFRSAVRGMGIEAPVQDIDSLFFQCAPPVAMPSAVCCATPNPADGPCSRPHRGYEGHR